MSPDRDRSRASQRINTDPNPPTHPSHLQIQSQWGVAPKPVEQLYTGNRKAAELMCVSRDWLLLLWWWCLLDMAAGMSGPV